MLKSWAWGVIVLVVGVVMLYSSAVIRGTYPPAIFFYFVAGLGAATAAYLAPVRKFELGASILFASVVLFGFSGYVAAILGAGDQIGIFGTLISMMLISPFVAFASICGALLGMFCSNKSFDTDA